MTNKQNDGTAENEVESEESEQGKEIEVDDEVLPSRAAAVHEQMPGGGKELERDGLALLFSAIAAGISMGTSLMAKGIFQVNLHDVPGGFLLENLGYTFGFIIVIMARQQLFTGNTVTAVLPVIHKPTLAGNIIGGTFIFALLSHAQIRNDMRNKAKAEAEAKAKRERERQRGDTAN